MNLYKVYLGPKDGDLDYFGETIEAKDAAEATEKAYKYRLLYWQCAANMGRMKSYMDIFNDLYNSSQVCSPRNYELEIRHYVENNVDCLVELT